MVDECLFRQIAEKLRDRGHDVIWAKQTYPGNDDEFILGTATAEGRIVLTEDKDFGNLAVRLQRPAIGIVIAAVGRLPGTIEEKSEHVARIVDELGDECIGKVVVIEPGRVRQRSLTAG